MKLLCWLGMRNVLALILGGGQGSRLHPLTQFRSKPAVPIGGKYRLIDVPISNCLHADLRRIFVLTQFNSASLNRHVSSAYRMDLFSRGFVEILAAEQTPESTAWFQGTADAVRKARRHFIQHDASHYLILAGDHLYRMNYAELLQAHLDRDADVTIAALPVDEAEATGMGIFTFDPQGRIAGFEEKPNAERLRQMAPSLGTGAGFVAADPDKPYIASMGIYLFSRDVLIELLAQEPGHDFGRELIPAALDPLQGARLSAPRLLGGCRHHRELLRRQHHADAAPARRSASTIQRCPIYTHARFLPPSKLVSCQLRPRARRRGLLPRERRGLRFGRRYPHLDWRRQPHRAFGAARRRLLRAGTGTARGADRHRPRRGAGPRDRGQERAHRRRRAAGQRPRAWSTRTATATTSATGIIIVPKDGTIAPGTVV